MEGNTLITIDFGDCCLSKVRGKRKISGGAKPENVEAMTEAVFEYGVY
jgi:hypothetical protein